MRYPQAGALAGLTALIIISIFAVGCGSKGPLAPYDTPSELMVSADSVPDGASRMLWGLWDVRINATTGEFEILPLRGTCFHLNAVEFLEPPALTGLTFDAGTLVANQGQNYVEVDVIINHPFPGLNQYSGFDVRGIVMLPGSHFPFSDPSLIVSGPGEPKLLNPDGWSRWWNPREFPGTGLFGFQPGLIGSGGGAGVFTATLNPYKYFADDLGFDALVTDLTREGRGSFSAGSSNKRHYKISFGDDMSDWLTFQYAVDASWAKPAVWDNPSVPDDFPPAANASEGYYIEVTEVENTMWWLEQLGTGGSLLLSVDVYTWRPEMINRVTFDSLGIVNEPVEATVVPGSGGGPDDPVYSTYTFEIEPDALSKDGEMEYLISVESMVEYSQGGTTTFFGPVETRVTGYSLGTVKVDFIPPLTWELISAGLLPIQPATVGGDFSVVGKGAYAGVYFFNNDYRMYRYALDYSIAYHVTTLAGFFGYSQVELYGAPETLGRFDVCRFGQFVASTYSAAPSPTFLGGLKRDYAFFFNEFYEPDGQLPRQIGVPDPNMGFFEFIDASANWSNQVEDAKIYWIQVDDPDEPTEPDPGITVILGVYQYGFTGNPFSGDVDYLSGSLVPIGEGDGLVDITCLDRFGVDSDPQGFTGSTDLVCWFLETDPAALECFSVVSTDDSGDLNEPITTIHDFAGAPRDIAVMPTSAGGYSFNNWVVVLEEGGGEWYIESFDQTGAKMTCLYDIEGNPLIGFPAGIDVDDANYRIHVWFSIEPGGPLYSSIFALTPG